MSLDLGYQSLDVKLTGKTVYVPDNHLAKLMYYLSCVAVVLEVDKNNKLLEYQNYYLLTEKEEELVVVFALLFSPKTLKEKFLFLVGDKYVPPGTSNEFYELTNNNFGVHISSEVIIGGVSRKVFQLMGCTESWLDRNYYNPLTHYINSRPDLFEKEKKIIVNQLAIALFLALILVVVVVIVAVVIVVKKFVALFFGVLLLHLLLFL